MDEMQMAALDLLARFKGMGFVLVVFPVNESGINKYITNVQKQDAAVVLSNAAYKMGQGIVPASKPLNGNG